MPTFSTNMRSVFWIMPLPFLCMISPLSWGAEIPDPFTLSQSTDSLQDFVEIPLAFPLDLVDHEKNHLKVTREQRVGLVSKGYALLVAILKGEEDTFPHKLEFLSHYKEMDEHWKLPGVPYGDKSQREILLDTATYVASAPIYPVYYLYSKAATCFWSSSDYTDEGEQQEKLSDECGLASEIEIKEISYEDNRRAHLESIVSLIWALYDISYKAGNAFVRGSIIVDDCEQKIHDYLERYCCLAGGVSAPEYLSNAVYNPFGSNLAYNRQGRSSHFVGRALTHYGIDARFQPRNFAQGVFPYSMTHLLFGRVSTTTGKLVTFIKVEEEGLGDLRAAAKHALNYALSVSTSNTRREKDIPKEIAEGFYNFFEALREDPAFFKAILEKNNMSESAKGVLNKLSLKYVTPLTFEKSEKIDIAWMCGFLWDVKDIYEKYILDGEVAGKIRLKANHFLDCLNDRYSEETLFMRTGNEVLFSYEQICEILGIPFKPDVESCASDTEEKNDPGPEKTLAENMK